MSNKQKLRLIGAFAALGILVLAASCTGFFVNPTVSSITIDPSAPTVGVGQTQQMTAAGTDSNGNALTLTAGTSCTGTTVCWSSGTPSVASINTGGLLTGVSVGTATITASSGTATATATATVALSNITSILVSPTSISVPVSSTASGSNCLTAKAQPGNVDVTTTVTWNTPDTSLITVENGEDPMCVLSSSSGGSTTVYATYTLGDGTVITSNSVDVTVSGS
jgi:trimeric autotransporter adhesin